VVMLRDGVYAGTGNKNLEFHGRVITVRSEHGPAACIIDCEQRGRAFYFADAESTAARVDGLTITNGSMNWGGGHHQHDPMGECRRHRPADQPGRTGRAVVGLLLRRRRRPCGRACRGCDTAGVGQREPGR